MYKFHSFGKLAALVLITLFFALTTSCDKSAGYGGTSTISGKIVTKYYNEDYSSLIMESPAVDEDVFLIFGEGDIVGDKVVTGPAGSFEFPYLRPGTYSVYFMSEDSTSGDFSEHVLNFDVDLAAGEDKDLGTLSELKTLEYNDGTAKISGVIRLINYKNTSEYPFLEVKDTSFAQDYEVYLQYAAHDYYDERIRTSYNGFFEFSELIPGDYKVFTYSEDVTGATENITIIRNVTISETSEAIDLGVLFVEQL